MRRGNHISTIATAVMANYCLLIDEINEFLYYIVTKVGLWCGYSSI